MADLIEEHWKRGVQDRVYFKTSDGVQVGWLDLKTGREILIDLQYKSLFDAAVDRWAAHHSHVRASRSPLASAMSTEALAQRLSPSTVANLPVANLPVGA